MRIKKAMMQTIKLVEYNYLSVNLKTDSQKKINKKLKELENKIENLTG